MQNRPCSFQVKPETFWTLTPEIRLRSFLLQWFLKPVAQKNLSFIISDISNCDNDDGCHDNATCVDGNGSYTCNCTEGFTGDGFNCTGKFFLGCNKSSCARMYFQHFQKFNKYAITKLIWGLSILKFIMTFVCKYR